MIIIYAEVFHDTRDALAKDDFADTFALGCPGCLVQCIFLWHHAFAVDGENTVLEGVGEVGTFYLIRHQMINHPLITVVAIEVGEHKPPVLIAAPAPVDMIIASCVIAIEDEFMTTLLALSAIQYRTLLPKVATDVFMP